MLRGGIKLTLMIGPVTPAPVPQFVLDALSEVTVTTADIGRSGFQLSFRLSTGSPLHTLFSLKGSSPIPFMRVIIVVTLDATPHVLMDGFITNHQVAPGSDASHATLTLTGEDLSVIMDKLDLSGFPFPATPAEGRVLLLLAKYAVLGVIPNVIPSVLLDMPIPTTLIPAQKGTDLAYINELAEDVGYVFYIEPGPQPGQSVAYWGPQLKIGTPQPALTINMDAATNVESLSFTFDQESNGLPTVFLYEEKSKAIIPVPIPDITPLSPPLGLVPPIPTHLRPIHGVGKYSPPRAIMIGMAKAANWSEAVTGEGSLNVLRYGRILKARQLVGVRGAGLPYDGLHYVKSVTHTIKRGEYKQSFKLSRNGLLPTVPKVRP
jgi:hypothetical protein